MQIYLPIAEVSINAFVLLGLGGITGILAGMFGVGGGFLMTPLLLFMGIPPPVVIATESSQIVASSCSGFLAHFRNKYVDIKMGMILVIGGLFGVFVGITLFNFLKSLGHIDLLIRGSYTILLTVIGVLMLIESIQTLRPPKLHIQQPSANKTSLYDRAIKDLPFKVDFPTSSLRMSCLPVLLIGFIVGILAATMGIGGGFIMVPAMIYILRMPTKVVVGTSLFQVIFISACSTLLHTITNASVDLVLSILLSVGGVVGAQLGSNLGVKIHADKIRILFSLLILAVVAKFLFDFMQTPQEFYSIAIGMPH